MRPHTLSPLPPFDRLFLTDAGLETDLIYNHGIDLPFFASISLLRTESGRQALKDYYRPYLELAARHGAGFVRGVFIVVVTALILKTGYDAFLR